MTVRLDGRADPRRRSPPRAPRSSASTSTRSSTSSAGSTRPRCPPRSARLFGAEQVTIVVPAPRRTDPLAAAWRTFAGTWSGAAPADVDIVAEDAPSGPASRTARSGCSGAENRWRAALGPGARPRRQAGARRATRSSSARPGRPGPGTPSPSSVAPPGERGPRRSAGRGATSAAALPGLARKLPHYGKHSYVAFRGDGADNVAKGQWPAPARRSSRSSRAARTGRAARARDPARPRAARPPRPAVRRGAPARPRALPRRRRPRRVGASGRRGSTRRPSYVAKAFAAAGLEPGGDGGTLVPGLRPRTAGRTGSRARCATSSASCPGRRRRGRPVGRGRRALRPPGPGLARRARGERGARSTTAPTTTPRGSRCCSRSPACSRAGPQPDRSDRLRRVHAARSGGGRARDALRAAAMARSPRRTRSRC